MGHLVWSIEEWALEYGYKDGDWEDGPEGHSVTPTTDLRRRGFSHSASVIPEVSIDDEQSSSFPMSVPVSVPLPGQAA